MKLLFLAFLCIICINLNAQKPAFTVTAKVVSIDTIKYYIVIKAISKQTGKKYTILSVTEKKDKPSEHYLNSSVVQIGKEYRLKIQATSRLRISNDDYLFLNLRAFDVGKLHLLNSGELPYVALNMYKYNVYW